MALNVLFTERNLSQFLLNDKWCFAYYENHDSVIVLELIDQDFSLIIFHADNLEQVKQQISEKIMPVHS